MRVLVAEDNRTSRKILAKGVQSWGYETTVAEDGKKALDLLAQPDGPRLAILDWEMPELDGLEVCRQVRAMADLPFRYLIVLTGRDREEDMVTALDNGANDYICKPWTPGELRARLGCGQRMIALYEELEERSRQLAASAQTDYLTGLWNRSFLMSRLDSELSRAKREHLPLAVFMIDVDHFKQVNDTRGHAAGDQVLVGVAERIGDLCRDYDTVGRYGGEEFLALIGAAGYEEVVHLAERFRKKIAAQPSDAQDTAIRVTASIGVAWLPPGGKTEGATLIDLADRMLYRAKENGRNRVEACSVAQPGLSDSFLG